MLVQSAGQKTANTLLKPCYWGLNCNAPEMKRLSLGNERFEVINKCLTT